MLSPPCAQYSHLVENISHLLLSENIRFLLYQPWLFIVFAFYWYLLFNYMYFVYKVYFIRWLSKKVERSIYYTHKGGDKQKINSQIYLLYVIAYYEGQAFLLPRHIRLSSNQFSDYVATAIDDSDQVDTISWLRKGVWYSGSCYFDKKAEVIWIYWISVEATIVLHKGQNSSSQGIS